MNRKTLLFLILAVPVFFVLRGVVMSVFFTWALFYILRSATPQADRRAVIRLLSVSLALRVILFCILQYFILSRGMIDIFGDAQDNITQGVIFDNYFRGAYNVGKVLSIDRYNTHTMSFFNGIFFAVFGYDLVSLKYLNILAVTAAGWLIYDFLRRSYSSSAGKIAAAIFLFWPTLILWSLTDLKEAHFIFCLVAIFWILRMLSRSVRLSGRLFYLLLLAALAFYVVFLKYKLMLPLALLTASALIFYYLYMWFYGKSNRAAGRFLVFVFLFGTTVFLRFQGLITQKAIDYYGIIISYYKGFINSGGWNFNIITGRTQDFFSVPVFVKYFFGGWFHFMTEPLPGHLLYSYSLLVMAPVMLIWYLLIVFSMAGMVKLKRAGRLSLFVPMLLFMFFYVTMMGMSVANIGTVIRFRDTIMPVVAMLASCALCLPDRGKEPA